MYIAQQTFMHGKKLYKRGTGIKDGEINQGYIKKLLDKGLIATQGEAKKPKNKKTEK